ncbi:antiactivator of flagellar biosynthesis FleN protein [Undibacterium seohonense]|uniref:Antiactivator of flagellar biosynthesis FleN protein n=1 Tax=Undibacterium seohonense TaxID=1344950 RepID=A0ABR6X8N2_9BURK|nr:antiactivator of flagellar biosynthesis FleN protein [Undibacterium seohonense]MBC3808679.1 antiactivator of flagellar biosynthesis FleN protein [Undibacterium seohonense]
MANYDQAEGLRRMLELPKLRVLTFLSALPDVDRNGMLINLSASFARQGKNTLMVDAKSSASSLSAWLNLKSDQTLLEVARQQRTMDAVIKLVSPGLCITKVAHGLSNDLGLPPAGYRELSKVFDLAVNRSDVVVVDGELNDDGGFILSSFEDSEMLIQVSADPATITNAYSLIKRLNNRLGRRTYGVVVSGVDAEQAQRVFSNLAMTARRYLAVELNFVGYVPADVHLTRATESGRTVIDAFPLSKAANAFVRMAEKLVTSASQSLRFDAMSPLGVQFEY